MAFETSQIDTTCEVVTPENIAFEYRLAGPFQRIGALALDYLFRGLIFLFFLLIAGLFSFAVRSDVLTLGGSMVIIFLLSWFYGGLFETYWNGQTPGKRILGLRVVGTNGQPIFAWQAILRNILREVDFFPLIPLAFFFQVMAIPIPPESAEAPIPLGLLGFLACAMNSRFQRLGDLAAGTMVICESRGFSVGLTILKEPNIVNVASSLPLDIRVTRKMAHALAKYVQRRVGFTPLRRAELARRLGEPLRMKHQIRNDITDDLLLCGLYYRTFMSEKPG
jgi:uncharacterized RDD family membrane protein YckC